MVEHRSDASALALKFLSGPEAGRVMVMKNPMKFGRHRDNHVCLSYDDRVSRFHAEIRTAAGGRQELADLGSTNGSIRGDRVLRGESTSISPGDTFRLGSTIFLLDWLDRLQPGQTPLTDKTSLISTSEIDSPSVSARQTEAVLIADMQSSTSLGALLGEAKMLRLKQELFEILQRAAHRHDTQFTKQTGDGYLMTFPTMGHVISAIRAIVGDIARHNARTRIIHPLRIRLSLTLGETLCDNLGDRHGQVVNLAFRLISLSALPGEMPGDPDAESTMPLITVTQLVESIRQAPWDPAPPPPLDLPAQQIKGFAEPIPISIFQLRPDVGTTA
jgi:class 3 adenylate cyclase